MLMGMKSIIIIAVAFALFVSAAIRVGAQYPAPPPQPGGQLLAPAQLDQLTGPIALYPDPLVAQVLPAAGQISQIVLAENYLSQGGDPNAIDQQPWDVSVKAVAHYPDVLKQLDGNLQWTMELGQAFLNQPGDVMDSIQRLRVQAQSLGNLQTTPQQIVEANEGDIEIVPANPQYVYVPTYDPGLIYYQPGCSIIFGGGFGIGLWLNHDFDWHHHRLFVWDHDHPRPGNWWRERPAERREVIGRAPDWHPQHRDFGRPPVAVRHDRGFEPPNPHRVEPLRPGQPPHLEPPAQVEPPHESAPRPVPAPAPVPVSPPPVRVRPSPFAPSAFSGVQNANESRAASQRGGQSHPVFSRPAVSPPAVNRPSPPTGNDGGGRKR